MNNSQYSSRHHQKVLNDPVSRLLALSESGETRGGGNQRGSHRLAQAGEATGTEPGANPDSGGRYIIGLSGYPGSGKSTICQQWADEVNRERGEGSIVILGMDGFHRSKAELRAMDNPDEAFARRGAPYTFNPTLFIEKLRELRSTAGQDALGWPAFEHEVGDPVIDAITVNPESRLILVEGIYVLLRQDEWAGLDGLFDETWFLDTPLETSMQRLYKRHQQAWGLSEEQARVRADSNDRLNCEIIQPGRVIADFLVEPGMKG